MFLSLSFPQRLTLNLSGIYLAKCDRIKFRKSRYYSSARLLTSGTNFEVKKKNKYWVRVFCWQNMNRV